MRIISYNINRNGDNIEARYRRLAKQIYKRDPDIVFLHEVIQDYVELFVRSGYMISQGKKTVVLYKYQYENTVRHYRVGTVVTTDHYVVASTHARCGYKYSDKRQRQALSLYKHCKVSGKPIILAGDVNTEEAFGPFTDTRKFYELDMPGKTWFKDRSNLKCNYDCDKKYDRAFCSNEIEASMKRLVNKAVDGVYSSDHDGILVTIE